MLGDFTATTYTWTSKSVAEDGFSASTTFKTYAQGDLVVFEQAWTSGASDTSNNGNIEAVRRCLMPGVSDRKRVCLFLCRPFSCDLSFSFFLFIFSFFFFSSLFLTLTFSFPFFSSLTHAFLSPWLCLSAPLSCSVFFCLSFAFPLPLHLQLKMHAFFSVFFPPSLSAQSSSAFPSFRLEKPSSVSLGCIGYHGTFIDDSTNGPTIGMPQRRVISSTSVPPYTP